MTYAELVAARDTLETALVNYSGGAVRLKIGDREIEYANGVRLESALNRVIRALSRYAQTSAGQTPGIRTASFN